MLAALCSLVSSTASSCTFLQMSLEEAQSQTNNTVIARVLQVIPIVESGFSRSFRYKVKVLASERGMLKPNALVEVNFEMYLATEINGRTRCPLNSGSGIENQLKAGSSYRFLLAQGEGDLELYWAEVWTPAAGTPESGE